MTSMGKLNKTRQSGRGSFKWSSQNAISVMQLLVRLTGWSPVSLLVCHEVRVSVLVCCDHQWGQHGYLCMNFSSTLFWWCPELLVCYCGIVHEAIVGILATKAVLCTILHIASTTSNRPQVNLFFVHYNGSAMLHSAHCTNNQPKIASTACSLYL